MVDLSEYHLEMDSLSLSDFKLPYIRRIVKDYNFLVDCYNVLLKDCDENDIELIVNTRFALTVAHKFLSAFKVF